MIVGEILAPGSWAVGPLKIRNFESLLPNVLRDLLVERTGPNQAREDAAEEQVESDSVGVVASLELKYQLLDAIDCGSTVLLPSQDRLIEHDGDYALALLSDLDRLHGIWHVYIVPELAGILEPYEHFRLGELKNQRQPHLRRELTPHKVVRRFEVEAELQEWILENRVLLVSQDLHHLIIVSLTVSFLQLLHRDDILIVCHSLDL